MKKILLLASLMYLLVSWTQGQDHLAPVGDEAFEVIRDFYNYDRGFSLEVRILAIQNAPEYARQKFSYRSVSDDPGMGYIAVPKGEGPFPCVLALHGLTGSKENWWIDGYSSGLSLTQKLLQAGFAVVCLDAKYHGERLDKYTEEPGTMVFGHDWGNRSRDMMVQTVVDYRRIIDYLEEREDIDASRLGMVGYSMGGMMTFFLSAIDDRIDVGVACVTPYIPRQYSAMAPHQFAPRITQPFLALFGDEDQFYSVNEGNYMTSLIKSEVKETVFYEAGHKLPVEWTDRAAEWFTKYLR